MKISFREEEYLFWRKVVEDRKKAIQDIKDWMCHPQGGKLPVEYVLEMADEAFLPLDECDASTIKKWYVESFVDLKRERIDPEMKLSMVLSLYDIDLNHLNKLSAVYEFAMDYLKKHKLPLEGIQDSTESNIPINVRIEQDKSKFYRMTSSADENKILKSARKLIEAIKEVQDITTVYPALIQNATSNLIGFDLRKNKYVVNIPSRGM